MQLGNVAMAVKKILMFSKHEKTLRTKSEPVVKINREIKALFQDLKDTMEDSGNAIGLAAPQIGVMKRVFAVRLGYEGGNDDGSDDIPEEALPEAAEDELVENEEIPVPPPVIMVNPEIVEKSEELEKNTDGCLSVPGMVGYTLRHYRIRVKYLDEAGKPQDRWFEGWDARMIQHENDHLDGIMFMDRLSTLDDLYVVAQDKDGNYVQIPYKQVVQSARKATSDSPRERLVK
jgi:peptide deformylase